MHIYCIHIIYTKYRDMYVNVCLRVSVDGCGCGCVCVCHDNVHHMYSTSRRSGLSEYTSCRIPGESQRRAKRQHGRRKAAWLKTMRNSMAFSPEILRLKYFW